MTADHATAVADAHAAGIMAGRAHRTHGILPVPPVDPFTGSMLARKCATAWHAGLAEGRGASPADPDDGGTKDAAAETLDLLEVKDGPYRYRHGWIKVGDPGTGGLDDTVRKANADRAKTGVLKRAQRQYAGIGGGIGVAGGSSDLDRPIADALTRATQTGKTHYVIPTALGMQASSVRVGHSSGYLQVTPAGEVSEHTRPDAMTPYEHTRTMSDHTVRGILDQHLSKTRTAAPPAPKPAKPDPDTQWSRSAIARAVKDIDKNPELQRPEFYQRVRDVAAKSGHADVIPDGWGTKGLFDDAKHPRGGHGRFADAGHQDDPARFAQQHGFHGQRRGFAEQAADVHRKLGELADLIGGRGRSQSASDRRLAATARDIRDELSEGPESADWEYIRGEMPKLAAAHADAARRGDAGDSSARALAAKLSDVHDALGTLAAGHTGPDPDHGKLPWDQDGDVLRYHGSLGIDRGDMPQISGTVAGRYATSSEMMPKFLDRLQAKGVTVTRGRVPPGTLKPTQSAGDASTVRNIADEIAAGQDTKPVLASADNRVIDGHHQWAGHVLAESEGASKLGGVPVIRVHQPAAQVIDEARQFAADEGIANRKTGVTANPKYAGTKQLTGGSAVPAPPSRIRFQVKGLFDEARHPRDRDGRFIMVGRTVHLADGTTGKVTGVREGGKVEVELAGGKRAEVDGREITQGAEHAASTGRTAAEGAAGHRQHGFAQQHGFSQEHGFAAASRVQMRPAAAKDMSDDDLHAADQEFQRRAVSLGKPGQVSKTHKAVRDELAKRAKNAKPGTGAKPLTDAEYEAHRQMVEKKVGDALAAGLATHRSHTLDPAGEVYTAERAQQHKEIVADMLANAAHVPNEGKGVIAGGLGGAGKTTVLTRHAGIDTSRYMTLNPDDVKEEMARRGMVPKIDGLSPMEASALVHEESSRITNMAAQQALAQKKNLIWDITMSSHQSAGKRVDDMRQAGYGHVHGVFVDIPGETSVERALARHRRGVEDYRQGKGSGGRYVPPELIRKSAGSGPVSVNRQAFETLRGRFDGWSMYDNSVHGRHPVRLAGGGLE